MNSAARLFLVIGAISGAFAVIAGAFGAHALADLVSESRLATFRIGAQYQLIHSVALVGVALLLDRYPSKMLRLVGWCFCGGILLFSGSLYALVLMNAPVLGAVTPLGGLAFICGWLLLAVGAWRLPNYVQS